MNFEDLKNPEFQEKLKDVKTPEELLALAKEEGYELTEAELEAVSGGDFWDVDLSWCSDKGPCARWFPK